MTVRKKQTKNEDSLENIDKVYPTNGDDAHLSIDDDGVFLNISEPDDVIYEEKKTVADSAKFFLKNFISGGSSEEKETATKTKSNRGRKKKFTTAQYTTMIAGYIAVWIGGYFDDIYKEVAPSSEQIDAIITPLAHIIDRHSQVVDVHPDVVDAFTCIAGIAMYGIQARATYVVIRQSIEKDLENERKANPYARDIYTIND